MREPDEESRCSIGGGVGFPPFKLPIPTATITFTTTPSLSPASHPALHFLLETPIRLNGNPETRTVHRPAPEVRSPLSARRAR